MTELSDAQRILLTTAAQRDSGSLLPLPQSLKPGGGILKVFDALLKRGLAEERETSDAGTSRRIDGDFQIGLFITPAGRAAIGVEERQDVAQRPEQPVEDAVPVPAKTSKVALVLNLLRRSDGATLSELSDATGWLPHTTRAALTGLRKKGHIIERHKRCVTTFYRLSDMIED